MQGFHNNNESWMTNIHNRRSNPIQNPLLSSNCNQLVNVISQLDTNAVKTDLLSHAAPINPNTMALLASLLNTTQSQSNSPVINTSSTPQEQHIMLYNLLANQLSSFQSDSAVNNNNTNISQLLHERASKQRETSLLNSMLLKSECQGDNISPSPPSSFQRRQYTLSDSSLTEELSQLALPYQKLMSSFENDIDKAANVYRNSASTVAQTSEAAYHWSGKLPIRVHRSMTFSRKVFLGGVPWDSTSEELVRAFSRFGNVSVCWPQKEGSSSTSTHIKASSNKGRHAIDTFPVKIRNSFLTEQEVNKDLNKTITRLDGFECYQAYTVVHSKNIEWHNEHLRKLFRRFCDANVTTNPSKCQLQLNSVSYLNYCVDAKSFKPDMSRLAPLIQASSPENISAFKS
ncbi:cytoplasmic polyadenylation element binding protein (cpeb), putative [Schistosoma mansoni]|uniref:cytoplasmic polyadenylation element binding protein (cpeb), putative n=1 Tax=Schistosoma mansoni TaxID=6183 RepID=UPI00022C8640|nr:cytoplasmic polyadenylation element binding protein (cpeb), putative [Schistosoma mansoni]|eukprot:XP_018645466.1 cytoplasmic polyadenylation element binding protein (cpeb), putative [Schistosoma mansoni]